MQQREKPSNIKPRIPKELRIGSTLSYQKFRQKGYRILPKLVVKFSDFSRFDQSLSSRAVRKIMLVKIFQKAKFIRDLDLSRLIITEQNFYSSKFRYIAKRLSNTSGLSLYDLRELKNEYNGLVTSWPKYMKRLQSFSCKIGIQKSSDFGFNMPLIRVLPAPPEKISLTTDYLRYPRGLKVVKVIFPVHVHAPYMDGIWKFQRYPPLIEKFSLHQAVCSTDTPKTSLEHFKKLKDLEIYFVYNSSGLLIKNVIPLISQLSQLEILNINFVDNFEIGPEACAAIKKLVNLKKIKLRLSVENHLNNLQILEALEECPLKALGLNVFMKDEEDTEKITRFLKRKNSIEHLKLRITKVTLLNSSDHLVELVNTIDNLPKLTSLMLYHKVTFVVKTSRETILPELDLSFKKLFSKPIPMKKFKIALNQFHFSHEGLANILESMKRNSSIIEKITIDIARYNIKTKQEVSSMLDFISGLKNIRSLKLFGMGVPTKPFFSDLVDVVCALKYLRVFYIGEVSAKVTQATFVNGVEKVLLKNGMEQFICETSADFKKTLEKKTKASPPDIDLEKIKSKNPYLENKPPAPIYAPEDRDLAWKVRRREHMQQREKSHQMKPLIRKTFKIDSTLSYQKFRQKGYRVFPKLAVKFKDSSSCEKSLYSKSIRKVMLTKIFKKAKFIRNLDLSSFLVTDQNFYFSKFRYIAKRLSNTLMLSLYDYRERKNGCKGLVTSWPKYMKRLQSFRYHLQLEISDPYGYNSRMFAITQLLPSIPKKISLTTDFLRYAPRLKAIKVIYPHNEHASYMDGIWKFNKYPPLIEKLSLCQAICSTNTLKTSLQHFKKLKDLEIYFVYNNNVLLMKNVIPLISQLSQLEILNVNFVKEFEIGPEACAAIKKLVNLKKLKLRLLLETYPKNLQILEALEDCPLKNLSLGVVMKDDEGISKITEFLNKKNCLEALKIRITRLELLKNSDHLVELVKAIDNNLLQLTSLVLSHKIGSIWPVSAKKMLPAIDLSFKNLLSKPIPMKKFKIALNQHTFSQEGFMNILENIKKTSTTIEKLKIDTGEYKPKTNEETDSILEFIRSLTNIRSLKLLGLGVPSRQFFSELVDVVCTLKYLRVLNLGEISGKVTKPTFVDGVEKVLFKYGLETFICETSAEFKKTLSKKSKACPDINLEKTKKKNPFLKNGPTAPIYFTEEKEEIWKVNIPLRIKYGLDMKR